MILTRLIDARFIGVRGLSACYLLTAKTGESALVDCGTPARYALITSRVRSAGVSPDQLTSIFLTHAHLDHSGNVSLFLRDFPHLKVYCHPTARARLARPEDIIRKMSHYMGPRWATEFRNQVHPVPESRMISAKDCGEIQFGGSTIQSLYTPGHSPDHLAFHEQTTKTLFTGDGFGCLYRTISPRRVVFTFTDELDIMSVYRTIDRIKRLTNVDRLALAHFGFVNDVISYSDDCHRFVDELVHIGTTSSSVGDDLETMYGKRFGRGATKKWSRLRGNMEANRMSLLHYFKRQDAKPGNVVDSRLT